MMTPTLLSQFVPSVSSRLRIDFNFSLFFCVETVEPILGRVTEGETLGAETGGAGIEGGFGEGMAGGAGISGRALGAVAGGGAGISGAGCAGLTWSGTAAGSETIAPAGALEGATCLSNSSTRPTSLVSFITCCSSVKRREPNSFSFFSLCSALRAARPARARATKGRMKTDPIKPRTRIMAKTIIPSTVLFLMAEQLPGYYHQPTQFTT